MGDQAVPERTLHVADCGVPITSHIRFPAWSLLEHMCLQANRGAGERSERSSCATVDIYASVLLCNACLHATQTCFSQDLECVSVKISKRAHACRVLQIDTIAA